MIKNINSIIRHSCKRINRQNFEKILIKHFQENKNKISEVQMESLHNRDTYEKR